MEQWLYVMFIEKTKTYNKLTKAAVERHVANQIGRASCRERV